jgi:2-oxoglutarate dehydrogenase E2 component (dihydrolipoamide succinyltransferase)
MAREDMVMPKMGESIMEGTIIEWKKKVGDKVELDETVLEIATDKVDSEVPAPIEGVIVEILAEEGDTIEVGEVIAVIDTEAEEGSSTDSSSDKTSGEEDNKTEDSTEKTDEKEEQKAQKSEETSEKESQPAPTGSSEPTREGSDGRFFSPLVRSIAKEEGISQEELESIDGSGSKGRVTKADVMNYLENRSSGGAAKSSAAQKSSGLSRPASSSSQSKSGSGSKSINAGEIHVDWPQEKVEVVKMDRMRKVIAEHMVRSKQTSAHVTTFNEADVTKLVQFRNKHKKAFKEKHGFPLTYTPFFIEATIQAIREFPLINSSVEDDNILLKKDINYGLAVALGESGTGGLIVPVIKNAGDMNLFGLAKSVYDVAMKARSKSLSPDDLTGGTFTLTNYGSVGNLFGTPIINQPQVAIFGTGSIEKKPVVMSGDEGDVIAIRNMCYLSMSYDHRIIDGALGGAFIQRVKDLLEDFDVNRTI